MGPKGSISTFVSETWEAQWKGIQKRYKLAGKLKGFRTLDVMQSMMTRLGDDVERFDPFKQITTVARIEQGSFSLSVGQSKLAGKTLEINIVGIRELVPVEKGWLAPL